MLYGNARFFAKGSLRFLHASFATRPKRRATHLKNAEIKMFRCRSWRLRSSKRMSVKFWIGINPRLYLCGQYALVIRTWLVAWDPKMADIAQNRADILVLHLHGPL